MNTELRSELAAGVLPRNPIEIASPDRNVRLNQLEIPDARDMFALIDRNREHLSQHGDNTSDKYPTYSTVLESIVHPKNPDRLRFAIRTGTGVFAGSINLTPDEDNRKRGEIGYYLGQEFTGKGLARTAVNTLTDYAFDNLGYEQIYGVVAVGNDASVHVLEGAGYTETSRTEKEITLTRTKPQ